MAEHPDRPDRPADRQDGPATGTRPAPGIRPPGGGAPAGGPASDRRASRPARSRHGAAALRRAVEAAATLVSLVTTAVVAVLAVHIVFVAFEANTANGIVRWFGDTASGLAWQFKDVFQPRNRKVDVAVNYGLAALVYLLAGRVVVGLIRRLATLT